jgi:MYXO-CTERM domain-containing protein
LEVSNVHRRIASVLSLTLVAGLGTGCNEPTHEELLGEAIATAASAIQGGYKDDVDTHVVGIVHVSNFGFGACSGTLISPNVILTAQHCVAQTSGNGGVQCGLTTFSPPYEADELYVTTKVSFSQNPADYHPALEIVVPDGGPEFCGRDQAIIILAEPISPEEAVPVVPRVDTALETLEPYYAVGFGETFDGGPSGTRYRRDDLVTYCVADTCPGQFVYEQEWVGDTGVCSGDSGGPAFDLANRVVGVASRGSAGCENPVYGHVYGWGQWIKDVTWYAAGLAGIDPPLWATGYPTDPQYSFPVGGACTQPSECASNVCYNGECSRACSELAYCPEGYECTIDAFCSLPPPAPKAENEADGGDDTHVSGCAVKDAGTQDPTKPIPWKTGPIALALALLWRRRRRS